MVMPLTTPSTNMQSEKTERSRLVIRPSTASTIRIKPKISWRFSGTITISQAFRNTETRTPAFRKVKVFPMLSIGSWKSFAMSPMTMPVTITSAPVSAYEKKLIQVSPIRLRFVMF